jgi:hypothetical protein
MYEVDTLSDLRSVVKEALQDIEDVTVLDYTESRFSTPAAIVAPSQPYIVRGNTFNGYTVRVDVIVLPGKGNTYAIAMEMDRLVEAVLHATQEYDLVEVSAPDEVTIASAGTFWGTIITLEFNTTFKEVM